MSHAQPLHTRLGQPPGGGHPWGLWTEGTARLRFTIDASDALVRSDTVRPAGPTREHRLLDKVADSKLAGCVFTAGIDETGRAVGGRFDVAYVWRLE